MPECSINLERRKVRPIMGYCFTSRHFLSLEYFLNDVCWEKEELWVSSILPGSFNTRFPSLRMWKFKFLASHLPSGLSPLSWNNYGWELLWFLPHCLFFSPSTNLFMSSYFISEIFCGTGRAELVLNNFTGIVPDFLKQLPWWLPLA